MKNNRKLALTAGFLLGWSSCLSADLLDLPQLPLAASESCPGEIEVSGVVMASEADAAYQVRYNTGDWSGSLRAYGIDSQGNIETEPRWDAAQKLNAMDPDARNILTFDSINADGMPLPRSSGWNRLNPEQQRDLGYKGPDSVDEALGQAMLAYIRGDRSEETANGGNLRTRGETVLGDIVNSAPVYVGPPRSRWPDYRHNPYFGAEDQPYSAFQRQYAGRHPMLYVGANDAMLHGFSAALDGGGDEKIAYIPGALYAAAPDRGLHYYAQPDYRHRFYVDLTPTVDDVFIRRSPAAAQSWRTLLIGGLRAGGRGLFALDITDPGEFAIESKADDILLWEFTHADDPDLGYTYSQPVIAMLRNGKWAAILGNGYNSTEGDNDMGIKSAASAVLFILFIENGVDGTWEAGDYIAIDTLAGSVDDPNGLSRPQVVDLNGDGVADRVYAGDIQGNMWAFDISRTGANGKLEASVAHGGEPLFTARTGAGVRQPITTAPRVAKHPLVRGSANNQPNLLVLFGTGKYLEPADVSDNRDLMSYYAVWDRVREEGAKALSRTHLVERKAITESDGGNARRRRVIGATIDWGEKYGWYLDLVERTSEEHNGRPEGERVVTESLLIHSTVFFNTSIPAGDPCLPGAGSSWHMALDIATGLTPAVEVFDANNDGVIDEEDKEVAGKSEDGLLIDMRQGSGEIVFSFSDGRIEREQVNVTSRYEGRLFWEELFRQ